MLQLFELLASNDTRCSAYCWRARMALRHKGLSPEYVGVPFTGMQRVAFAGAKEVPVLVDGDKATNGSFEIASYLENAYPKAPSLFGGPSGIAFSRFVDAWIEADLHPMLLRMVVHDLSQAVHPDDRQHFLETRSQRFGMPLTAVSADRDSRLPALRTALEPARTILSKRDFISGEGPGYPDYLLFSTFQWCRLVSPLALLDPADAVGQWFERMLDLNDGYARAMKPAYAAAA